MTNEFTTETIKQIPAHHVPEMTVKLEKLGRRAEKLGLGVSFFSVSERYVAKVRGLRQVFVDVTVNMPVPKLDGYEFVAYGERTTDKDVVWSVAENTSIPAWFSNDNDGECDHCGHDRDRRYLAIFRSTETQILRQVGKSCMRDFTGIDNAEKMVEFFRYIDEIRKEREEREPADGAFAERFHSLETLSMFTLACVDRWGWIPKRSHDWENGIVATAMQVFNMMYPAPCDLKESKEIRQYLDDNEESLERRVRAACEAWESDDAETQYVFNLQSLIRGGIVSRRHEGLAISMAPVHEQKLAKLKSQALNPTENAGHFGEIKKRERGIRLTVTRVGPIQYGDFGAYAYVDLVTENGHVISWANGKPETDNMQIGDKIIADFTPQAHNEFKGVSQTRVNRLAIKELMPA